DLREFASEERFDLVTGSPPYFPPGTATAAEHSQAVPARIEVRGGVADYAHAASRVLARGGVFAFVFPALQASRAESALRDAGLMLLRRRAVVFKGRYAPLISLFAAVRSGYVPLSPPLIYAPLTI